MTRQRALDWHLWPLLGMAAGLAACQSADIQPLGVTETDTVEQATAPAEKKLFPNDFKDACQGVPVQNAAAYEPTPGTIHPIYLLARDSENENFLERSSRLPEAWEKDWEQAAATELVVCLTQTGQQLAQTCDFEEAGEPTYTLEVYDTTYAAEVRVAQTGELLAAETLELAADSDCPMFHMFTEGETVDSQSANYEQAVLEFAKPYVQPEA